MDALFQEGQSSARRELGKVPDYLLRKRLKRFLTLTSKVWPATPSCTSLIRKIVRNRKRTTRKIRNLATVPGKN